jgi:hypothetical protein
MYFKPLTMAPGGGKPTNVVPKRVGKKITLIIILSSAPTILSFYILSPIHPSHSPSPGIRMTYLRGYTLSCGKKGLKAQEVKATGKS